MDASYRKTKRWQTLIMVIMFWMWQILISSVSGHILSTCFSHKFLGFLWCGYAINMKDLSVSGDYTRYYGVRKSWQRPPNCLKDEHNSDLRNTLTVNKIRRPGSAFVFKMLQYVQSTLWYPQADMFDPDNAKGAFMFSFPTVNSTRSVSYIWIFIRTSFWAPWRCMDTSVSGV